MREEKKLISKILIFLDSVLKNLMTNKIVSKFKSLSIHENIPFAVASFAFHIGNRPKYSLGLEYSELGQRKVRV